MHAIRSPKRPHRAACAARRHRLRSAGRGACVGVLALVFAAGAHADLGFAGATPPGPRVQTADEVLVVKSKRKLYLLREGEVLREFDVFLGDDPDGPKRRAGDERTPEGRYMLDQRNPDSDFFLSIRVSYPDARDRARARRRGEDPGGQIMIHGFPNERRYPEHWYESEDWTNGCIAVTDADMVDIWLMTREFTPIEIKP